MKVPVGFSVIKDAVQEKKSAKRNVVDHIEENREILKKMRDQARNKDVLVMIETLAIVGTIFFVAVFFFSVWFNIYLLRKLLYFNENFGQMNLSFRRIQQTFRSSL